MPLGGAGLADDLARPRCEKPSRSWIMPDRPAALRRAHHFPLAISRRASISSSLSATMRFSRAVLLLQLLQALGVVGLHAAVLVPPAVIGLLGHLEVPGRPRRCPAPSFSIRSASLSLRTICSGVCLRLVIVTILPSPTIVGNGLTSRVDRSQGVRPLVVRPLV